jgi:hypothetical protein
MERVAAQRLSAICRDGTFHSLRLDFLVGVFT